jgi:hypothetical protein
MFINLIFSLSHQDFNKLDSKSANVYDKMIRASRLCSYCFVIANKHHQTKEYKRKNDYPEQRRSLDNNNSTFFLSSFKKRKQNIVNSKTMMNQTIANVIRRPFWAIIIKLKYYKF